MVRPFASTSGLWPCKCRNVALRAAVLSSLTTAFIAYAGVSYASYEDACEYPDYFGSMFVAPEFRLGEFRIVLDTPDYSDAASIQKHLGFSTVLANLLSSELSDRTNGLCNAVIAPSFFPDLKAFLFSTSELKQGDHSFCVRILHDAIFKSQPSEKAIDMIAHLKAKMISQKRSNPAGLASAADAILVNSLIEIYSVNTVMHALVSADEKVFQSINARGFIDWLDSWRSAGIDKIVPIRTNCRPEIDGRSLSRSKLSSRLPYSTTVPSGIVKISINADTIMRSRALRYAVVVGADSRPNLPLLSSAYPFGVGRRRSGQRFSSSCFCL